ncbi:hypothetical protein RND71_014320 [Anisodus tanguticus]|uniref:Uncharacterized protein n=1 Tax=Anisodus tanguticus TaxID=243964 RepID=A0AAE1SB06_9SOLA|nr:hypothetical protein RND71_014320 [Anisodus tanguticus]
MPRAKKIHNNEEKDKKREAENWEFDEKIKKTEGLDLVAAKARGENEGEKDVTLTPGLPERNSVEVYVENSGGLEGNEDVKDTRPEAVEKPLESKDEKVDSLVREIQGTITEKGPEVTSEEKEINEVNQSGVSKKAKKDAEVDKTLPGNRDARNGKDVGQAANITKDPKVVSNGKHVAKDASRPSEGEDNLVSAKEAQRKVPHVNEVSGRAGIAEAKHTKVVVGIGLGSGTGTVVLVNVFENLLYCLHCTNVEVGDRALGLK